MTLKQPAPKIYKLVYVSTAHEALSEAVLAEILDKSRFNNQRAGITGLLLYCEGSIFQLLEGEKEAVERLYNRILKDPRHSGVIRLLTEEGGTRNFPDWTMGFRRVERARFASDPAFVDAIERRSLSKLNQEQLSRRVWILLTSFARTNRLEE